MLRQYGNMSLKQRAAKVKLLIFLTLVRAMLRKRRNSGEYLQKVSLSQSERGIASWRVSHESDKLYEGIG